MEWILLVAIVALLRLSRPGQRFRRRPELAEGL